MNLISLDPNECSSLSIDWTRCDSVERSDMYFIWADVTRRAGLISSGQTTFNFPFFTLLPDGTAVGTSFPIVFPGFVPALVERSSSSPFTPESVPAGVLFSGLYPAQAIFKTAQVMWSSNSHALTSGLRTGGPEGYVGFELGAMVDYSKEVDYSKTDGRVTAQGRTVHKPTTGTFGKKPVLKTISLQYLETDTMAWPRNTTTRSSDGQADSQLPLDGDVIAIIDHGCAFAHASFLDESGNTRVRYLWDQQPERRYEVGRGTVDVDSDIESRDRWKQRWKIVRGRSDAGSADGYVPGAELDGATLDELLNDYRDAKTGVIDERAVYADAVYEPLRHVSSHGTHVMSIAAGWPDPLASTTVVRDRAANAKIIFVQLPREAVADTSGGSMNTCVLDALRYILNRTTSTANVVVNLSYGSYSGPHDGTSRLERAVSAIIDEGKKRGNGRGRFDVVVAAGNAFLADIHSQGYASVNKPAEFSFHTDPDCRVDTFVEFWHETDRPTTFRIKPPGFKNWIEIHETCAVRCWGPDAASAADCESQPVLTVVRVDKASEGAGRRNHCTLVAIAPSRIMNVAGPAITACYQKTKPVRLDPAHQLHVSPSGIWQVEFGARDESPVEIHAWIDRDDFVESRTVKSQQARFLAPLTPDEREDHLTNQTVSRRGTLSGIATARGVVTVGGASPNVDHRQMLPMQADSTLALETSAGPSRLSSAATTQLLLGPSDERRVLPGILAAGNAGTALSRRSGTSVAAPAIARRLLGSSVEGVQVALGYVEAKRPVDELRGARRSTPTQHSSP